MAQLRSFLALCLVALACALLIAATQPDHFQSSASAWNISRTSSACTLQRAHSSSGVVFMAASLLFLPRGETATDRNT